MAFFSFPSQYDAANEGPQSDIEVDLNDDNDSEAVSDDSDLSSNSESEVVATEAKSTFKGREDFQTPEEYEKYILESVKVGASVSFKDKEQSQSEVGIVTKVS